MGLFKLSGGNNTHYSSVNPDPGNYKINFVGVGNGYTVAGIEYFDCVNFGGLKVLVYEGDVSDMLLSSLTIDPHFLDQSSPIVRIRPDKVDSICTALGINFKVMENLALIKAKKRDHL